LTHRRNLKCKCLDLENAIRHSLKAFGIRIHVCGRGGFAQAVREAVAGDALVAELIDAMLNARATLWKEYCRLEMQKMRTLLANRKLLKRKLIDIENHIRGSLRAYGLLIGTIGRGGYEARVRELLERCDPIFVMTIEVMLDVRRAIFDSFDRLHRVLLQVVQHDLVCHRLMTVPGVA
jgi:transposase